MRRLAAAFALALLLGAGPSPAGAQSPFPSVVSIPDISDAVAATVAAGTARFSMEYLMELPAHIDEELRVTMTGQLDFGTVPRWQARVNLPDSITTGTTEMILVGRDLYMRDDDPAAGPDLPAGTWLHVDYDDPPPGWEETGGGLLAPGDLESLFYLLLGHDGDGELVGIEPSDAGDLLRVAVPIDLDLALARAPESMRSAFDASVAAFQEEGGAALDTHRAEVWLGDDGLVHGVEYTLTFSAGGQRLPTILHLDLSEHGAPLDLGIPDPSDVIDALDLASDASSGALGGQSVDVPAASYTIWSPGDWVTMTPSDADMDPLIEALQRDRGPEAGDLLRGRFAYLNTVMDEWPPLFVLPTDGESTLGCGVEAVERPPRPLDEWLAEVRLTASFGRMPISFAPEPVPVDLGIGRVWALPGVTDAAGARQDVHHTLYLVGGDGVEITATCSALEPTEEAYWRPVVEGIEFPTDGERRVELPAAGFALTLPDGWSIHTSGLAGASNVGRQHLIALRPDGPRCNVWHWQDAPIDGVALGDLGGFARAFMATFREGSIDVQMTETRLPAGQAIHIDDRPPTADWYRTAYLLTDGAGYYSLTCYGFEPPDDRWLSIAETFEFLPAEE